MKNLKTYGFIALVIVILFLVVVNGCQRKRLIERTQNNSSLSIENEMLKNQKKVYQDSLDAEKKKREVIEVASAELIKERDKLAIENKKLRKKIADVPAWVNSMPIDSNYEFVNDVAYPFDGEQKYPLNEEQIKGIHSTFLKSLSMSDLIDTQAEQMKNCELRVANSEAFALSFKNSLALCDKQKENDQSIIKNMKELNGILEKDLKRNINKRNFWRTTTLIGAGGIIILLL